MTSNAKALSQAFDQGYTSPVRSVNSIADDMGWGWHRTNNALKELGYK